MRALPIRYLFALLVAACGDVSAEGGECAVPTWHPPPPCEDNGDYCQAGRWQLCGCLEDFDWPPTAGYPECTTGVPVWSGEWSCAAVPAGNYDPCYGAGTWVEGLGWLQRPANAYL